MVNKYLRGIENSFYSIQFYDDSFTVKYVYPFKRSVYFSDISEIILLNGLHSIVKLQKRKGFLPMIHKKDYHMLMIKRHGINRTIFIRESYLGTNSFTKMKLILKKCEKVINKKDKWYASELYYHLCY